MEISGVEHIVKTKKTSDGTYVMESQATDVDSVKRLSKVGKTNDYYDLDNIPSLPHTIPGQICGDTYNAYISPKSMKNLLGDIRMSDFEEIEYYTYERKIISMDYGKISVPMRNDIPYYKNKCKDMYVYMAVCSTYDENYDHYSYIITSSMDGITWNRMPWVYDLEFGYEYDGQYDKPRIKYGGDTFLLMTRSRVYIFDPNSYDPNELYIGDSSCFKKVFDLENENDSYVRDASCDNKNIIVLKGHNGYEDVSYITKIPRNNIEEKIDFYTNYYPENEMHPGTIGYCNGFFYIVPYAPGLSNRDVWQDRIYFSDGNSKWELISEYTYMFEGVPGFNNGYPPISHTFDLYKEHIVNINDAPGFFGAWYGRSRPFEPNSYECTFGNELSCDCEYYFDIAIIAGNTGVAYHICDIKYYNNYFYLIIQEANKDDTSIIYDTSVRRIKYDELLHPKDISDPNYNLWWDSEKVFDLDDFEDIDNYHLLPSEDGIILWSSEWDHKFYKSSIVKFKDYPVVLGNTDPGVVGGLWYE